MCIEKLTLAIQQDNFDNTTLDLSNQNISSDQLTKLLEAINQTNLPISTINLTNSQLDDAAFGKLCEFVATISSLICIEQSDFCSPIQQSIIGTLLEANLKKRQELGSSSSVSPAMLSRKLSEEDFDVRLKAFLRALNHETKNGLQGIINLQERLKQLLNSDIELCKAFDDLVRANHYLKFILETSLKFENFGIEEIEEQNNKTFKLKSILETIQKLTQLFNTNIKFFNDIKDFSVKGNKRLLLSAIINMLRPALSFTSSDEKIEIGLYVIKNDKKSIECIVSICNTGTLELVEQQRSVYEKYITRSTSLREIAEDTETPGIGLPLKMVEEMINRKFGGKISFEVQENKFKLNIQLNLPKSHELRLKKSSAQKKSFYEVGKSPKVLVVEDNPINMKTLVVLLTKLGCENVIQAENGQKALNLIEQGEKVDIILMDINMPIMDGYEATRKIHEYQSLEKTPVIFVTAASNQEVKSKVQEKQLQISGYLQKPVTINTLTAAMSQVLPSPRPEGQS